MKPCSLKPVAKEVQKALRVYAQPGKAQAYCRFFKTGKGEYGEGDRFIGVTVPETRSVTKLFSGLSNFEIRILLRSPVHEDRLAGLLILVKKFQCAGTEKQRSEVCGFYLQNRKAVNNWDLVDVSADKILGAYLEKRPRSILRKLIRSSNVWERRMAMVSCFHFIRKHDFETPLELAACLLRDPHDLMHKAAGWMLREIGKRNVAVLEGFLKKHSRVMPRTMLRYAIERFPEARRKAYLHSRI